MMSPFQSSLIFILKYLSALTHIIIIVICDRLCEKVRVAHTMIFLYKRCCSKTRNIFYSLKNFFLA